MSVVATVPSNHRPQCTGAEALFASRWISAYLARRSDCDPARVGSADQGGLGAWRRLGKGVADGQVLSHTWLYLEAAGFRVTVAWGRQRGVDIRAESGAEVMLLEAKGSAVNPPQQVNYFLGALGELLQRMSDRAATYGLALPDSQQYRGLAARLPALAWPGSGCGSRCCSSARTMPGGTRSGTSPRRRRPRSRVRFSAVQSTAATGHLSSCANRLCVLCDYLRHHRQGHADEADLAQAQDPWECRVPAWPLPGALPSRSARFAVSRRPFGVCCGRSPFAVTVQDEPGTEAHAIS